jgi:hypothetical protein
MTPTPPPIRVTGSLRSSLEEPGRATVAPPKKPGSGVFGRMPKPTPPTIPVVAPRQAPPPLPSLRPRRRLAGLFLPVLIAAVGIGAGAVLWEASGRWMFAALCVALGLVGAAFSRALLAERVEVS